ncbi:MAG: hypothetical protein CM15mP39_04550 [Synechococcus sp.]|nr:MAG: hypothetical protein CM15mP39_04550 [Synechococcus sp.]
MHQVMKRFAVCISTDFFETELLTFFKQSIDRLAGYFFVFWYFNKRGLKTGILTF